MTQTVKCPTCSKQVKWSKDSQWRPFCSERCKLIDLGEWASEAHRIPGQQSITKESLEEELIDDNKDIY